MVAMSYIFPPAEYLIPADLKLSTIRRRNPNKEDQIRKFGILQHYWKQRTAECRLLGVRQLRKLEIIDVPIIEFIHTAPDVVIYREGFGHDRAAMESFFTLTYDDETLGTAGAFYMVTWWPMRWG